MLGWSQSGSAPSGEAAPGISLICGCLSVLERVRQLRTEGKAPKHIARILGVAPSAVVPLVRAVAAERDVVVVDQPVVGCSVNQGWSRGLSVGPDRQWPDEYTGDEGTAGLVGLLMARRHRFDQVQVSGYLVDVYCLGVKNAFGPEVMDEFELRRFQPEFFSAFLGWQPADLELARQLVFGAVDYARALGFEPHGDFAKAAALLGSWTGPSAIGFGQNGRPSYVSGPYDDPRRIIRTLERSVGTHQFDFSVGLEGADLPAEGGDGDEAREPAPAPAPGRLIKAGRMRLAAHQGRSDCAQATIDVPVTPGPHAARFVMIDPPEAADASQACR